MGACVGYMLSMAWRHNKSVIFSVLALAAMSVGLSVTELYAAPQILQKVTDRVPIGELLGTIALFTLTLLLLRALKSYTEDANSLARVDVRTWIICDLVKKVFTTAYPNTLDPAAIKAMDGAMNANSSNHSDTERIWLTLTTLLTDVAGFLIYLVLLTKVSPWILLVILTSSVAGFYVNKKVRDWDFRHKEEEQKMWTQENSLEKRSQSVELAKDIRIFGLAPWLREIYNGVMRSHQALVERRHAVEQMGAPSGARIDRIEHLLLLRHAVPHGGNDAVFQHDLNEFVRTGDFRGEGHQLDASASRGDQFAGKDRIERIDALLCLRSRLHRIDERSFNMDPGRIGAFMFLFDHGGENIGGFQHRLFGGGGHGREEGCHAVGGQVDRHAVHQRIVVDQSPGCVESAGSVDVTVDESGDRVSALECDDLQSRFADKCGGPSCGDELVPVAEDGAGRDVFVRGQAVVCQKQFSVFRRHNSSLFFRKRLDLFSLLGYNIAEKMQIANSKRERSLFFRFFSVSFSII